MRQKRSVTFILGSLTLVALLFLIAKQLILSDTIYYAIWKPKFYRHELLWPQILYLPDHPLHLPFIKIPLTQGALLCYRPGLAGPATTEIESKIKSSTQETSTCPCNRDYYGQQCSIPITLHLNSSMAHKVALRHHPRRIIYFFTATQPESLEQRVLALVDVVDAFVVQDLSFNKSDTLLSRLEQGWLKRYQNQVAYVLPEAVHRKYIAQQGAPRSGYALGPLSMDKTYMRQWNSRNGGLEPTQTSLVQLDPPSSTSITPAPSSDEEKESWLSRQGSKQLGDVRLDDLVVYTNERERPTRELLLFLKTYDHYPLPLSLRKAAGERQEQQPQAFPIAKENNRPTANVVTFQMFRDWYNFDASCMASNNMTCQGRLYFSLNT